MLSKIGSACQSLYPSKDFMVLFKNSLYTDDKDLNILHIKDKAFIYLIMY